MNCLPLPLTYIKMDCLPLPLTYIMMDCLPLPLTYIKMDCLYLLPLTYIKIDCLPLPMTYIKMDCLPLIFPKHKQCRRADSSIPSEPLGCTATPVAALCELLSEASTYHNLKQKHYVAPQTHPPRISPWDRTSSRGGTRHVAGQLNPKWLICGVGKIFDYNLIWSPKQL